MRFLFLHYFLKFWDGQLFVFQYNKPIKQIQVQIISHHILFLYDIITNYYSEPDDIHAGYHMLLYFLFHLRSTLNDVFFSFISSFIKNLTKILIVD